MPLAFAEQVFLLSLLIRGKKSQCDAKSKRHNQRIKFNSPFFAQDRFSSTSGHAQEPFLRLYASKWTCSNYAGT